MELGGIRWNLEVFANSACGASWAANLLVGILLGQFRWNFEVWVEFSRFLGRIFQGLGGIRWN